VFDCDSVLIAILIRHFPPNSRVSDFILIEFQFIFISAFDRISSRLCFWYCVFYDNDSRRRSGSYWWDCGFFSDLVWIRSDDSCISDSYVSGISVVTIEETSCIINFSSLCFVIVTSQWSHQHFASVLDILRSVMHLHQRRFMEWNWSKVVMFKQFFMSRLVVPPLRKNCVVN
jgi:hypothetical protein